MRRGEIERAREIVFLANERSERDGHGRRRMRDAHTGAQRGGRAVLGGDAGISRTTARMRRKMRMLIVVLLMIVAADATRDDGDVVRATAWAKNKKQKGPIVSGRRRREVGENTKHDWTKQM